VGGWKLLNPGRGFPFPGEMVYTNRIRLPKKSGGSGRQRFARRKGRFAMKITYREFRIADTKAVLNLSKDVWKRSIRALEPLFAKYDGKSMKCFLAEAEGQIIGLSVGFILPNSTLLPELVYVLPECRQAGVGSKLLKTLEKHAGCHSAIIYYNKEFREYFKDCGYLASEQIEVAVKNI